ANSAKGSLLRLLHGQSAREPKGPFGVLIVSGDKVDFNGKDKLRRQAEVKFDASKTPRTIDLKEPRGTFVGIYKLDGDELVLCASRGDRRPTKFEAGPGQVLLHYKRTAR